MRSAASTEVQTPCTQLGTELQALELPGSSFTVPLAGNMGPTQSQGSSTPAKVQEATLAGTSESALDTLVYSSDATASHADTARRKQSAKEVMTNAKGSPVTKAKGNAKGGAKGCARTAPKPARPAPATLPAHALSVSVPKERQEASWDCGLACARMALLSLGCSSVDCSLARLRGRLTSSEVWSIDIAYLLSEYGCKCEYLTSSEQPFSPRRRECSFYAATLQEDGERVTTRLARAAEEGVRVRRASLTANEVTRQQDSSPPPPVEARAKVARKHRMHPFLSVCNPNQQQLWNTLREDGHIAIALVDPRLLYPTREGDSPAPPADARTFLGHYVLLVGLDDASDSYVVKVSPPVHEAAIE